MGDSFLEDFENFDQYIDEVNYIFPPQSCALNEQVLFYTVISSTSDNKEKFRRKGKPIKTKHIQSQDIHPY